MIIHSYFTNGFFDWAMFYLETLRYHNNLLYPVVFSTIGLNDNQISDLKTIYPNITINNKPLHLKIFSQRSGVKTALIAKYKKQCEEEFVNYTNKVWKLMTAGEDRIKALNDVLHEYSLRDFYILHSDIDVYFRGSLRPLFKDISGFDVTMRIRPKANPIKVRMSIGLMGYRINEKVYAFMDEWIKQIDKVPVQMRPIGFGQISCWEAYRRNSLILNSGNLPKAYGNHGKVKSSAMLWSGNIHNTNKTEVLARFKNDFNKIKKRIGE